MKPKHKRAIWLVLALASIAVGVSGLLTTFRDNIVFFFSPSEVLAKAPSPEKRIRVGGLVMRGSIRKESDLITFIVTDTANQLEIRYRGLPPNLFREGIGIVAEGYNRKGYFEADRLLAKHDEKYMPPEVSKALKDSGHWKTQYPNAGKSQ